MYKKCKILLLFSNTNISKIRLDNEGVLSFQPHIQGLNYNGLQHEYHHLYILSDDEIAENERCYQTVTKKIIHCPFRVKAKSDFRYSKIIATTDSSLKIHILEGPPQFTCEGERWERIPSIPQSFIDKYVSEYNKGNKIEDVMVEYESYTSPIPTNGNWDEFLSKRSKVNSDNTINIKSIKDSWTREEVKKLVKSIYTCNFSETFMKNVDEWIKENL